MTTKPQYKTKFRSKIILFMLFMTGWSYINAQSKQLYVGAGLAPIHYSGQADFNPFKMPMEGFIGYKQNSLGLRLNYNWQAAYQKDRFSFSNSYFSTTITYNLSTLMGLTIISPYLRAGFSSWKTEFTTEGYPGIEDYELKIEQDKGIGIISAIGITYPIRDYALGLEFQYAKNGNSQFIAGGFEPQNLLSDNMSVMLIAQYNFILNKNSIYGQVASCPKF